jgi:hypothetical protein
VRRGDVVRPVLSCGGLDVRRQYVVAYVERPSIWAVIAYLVDEEGTLYPVANAHQVLERVAPRPASRPSIALQH